MTINDIGEFPPFFSAYIRLVDNIDLMEGLERYRPKLLFDDWHLVEALGDRVYSSGKWTMKDIFQHCIDTERIMSYRALCIARNDHHELPGFDENNYAQNTLLSNVSLKELIDEYALLRESTIRMFKNFDKRMLLRRGVANKSEISPLALGFVIVGHPLHHCEVIRERYFKLLEL